MPEIVEIYPDLKHKTLRALFAGSTVAECEIDNKKARATADWSLLLLDLEWCLTACQVAIHRNAKCQHDSDKLNLIAFVLTYGRCFAKMNGKNIKLKRKSVPQHCIPTHDWIMTLRNDYAVHSMHSDRPCGEKNLAKGNSKAQTRLLAIYNQQFTKHKPDTDDWKAFYRLTREVYATVQKQYNKKLNKMIKWLNSLPLDALYSRQEQ